MIIGLAGRARSGKDTAAKALIERGFIKNSFAATIKHITADFLKTDIKGIERAKDISFPEQISMNLFDTVDLTAAIKAHINISEERERLLDYYIHGKKFNSIRDILQYLGTDLGRKLIDDDIWVNRAMEVATELAVFTDVRFPNEIEAIRRNGGRVIYIKRNKTIDLNTEHASERAVNPAMCDYMVDNNGSIADLHSKVLKTLGLE